MFSQGIENWRHPNAKGHFSYSRFGLVHRYHCVTSALPASVLGYAKAFSLWHPWSMTLVRELISRAELDGHPTLRNLESCSITQSLMKSYVEASWVTACCHLRPNRPVELGFELLIFLSDSHFIHLTSLIFLSLITEERVRIEIFDATDGRGLNQQ